MSTIKFVDTILQDPAANLNMTLLDAYLGQGEPPLRFNVGFRNADYALQALALEEIPVIAQKIKPDHGTRISFDTVTGEVILKVLRRMEA